MGDDAPSKRWRVSVRPWVRDTRRSLPKAFRRLRKWFRRWRWVWLGIGSRDEHEWDVYSATEAIADSVTDKLYHALVESPDFMLSKSKKADPATTGGDSDNGGEESSSGSERADGMSPEPPVELAEDDLKNLKNKALVTELQREVAALTRKKIIPEIAGVSARRVRLRIEAELREQYRGHGRLERCLDSWISWSRWIMALVYLTLPVALVCLLFFTVHEASKMLEDAWRAVGPSFSSLFNSAEISKPSALGAVAAEGVDATKESIGAFKSVIAPAVKILDLVLVGSLVVMVLIGGYENTVSRIGMKHSMPIWLGKLSISELKVKVSASIVIISSINLLEMFLAVSEFGPEMGREINNYYPLIATAGIHIVFIFSAIALTQINKVEALMHHSERQPDPKELREEWLGRDFHDE